MTRKLRRADASNARLFLSEVRNELKRVTWPSRREVYATTVVVIVTSIAMSLYLGPGSAVRPLHDLDLEAVRSVTSMSLRKRLRTLMVCIALEFGALIGTPMRPEEIKALMQAMNQPTLAHTIPDERNNDQC